MERCNSFGSGSTVYVANLLGKSWRRGKAQEAESLLLSGKASLSESLAAVILN